MPPLAAPSPRSWQCVLVAWGDRYPVSEINHLAATMRRRATGLARIVLLSDRLRPGLATDILLRPFPEFYLHPHFLTGGCHAKLAMFEAGVLPDDLPVVYVDLDTVVMGDLARLLPLLGPDDRGIAMLQSAVLPFGRLARAIHRLTNGRRYARGNSSILVFHPRHAAFVAERFRELFARFPDLSFHPMRADERFISWVAQGRMRAVGTRMAVKFPTEFMHRHLWIGRILAALPWVRARRAGLIAVTLPGVSVKGEVLMDLPEGALITDNKGRKVEWSARTLGAVRDQLVAHYRSIPDGPS